MHHVHRTVRASVLLLSLLLASAPAWGQYTVYTLHESGPAEERMALALLAEGYTESELPRFLEDARKVMGDFFAASPFDAYRDYLNVLAVSVASNESGADHPGEGIYRDTYFQVTYDADPFSRTLSITWPDGSDRLYEIQTALGLGWWNAVTLLLVNDERHGGAAAQGGGMGIVSRSFNEFGAAVHEIGHALGALGDEYVDRTQRPMLEAVNLTAETNRESVKWRHWFEEDTPIPTPFADAYVDRVGLFEGGGYVAEGVYRPQMICMMIDSSSPFCAVCREHLIGRMHFVNPSLPDPLRFRVTSPAQDMLVVSSTATLDFTLRTPMPTHGLSTQWHVNGVIVDEGTSELRLDAAALGRGTYTVELVVADETPMVRDPVLLPALTTKRRWELFIDTSVGTESEVVTEVLSLSPNFPNPVRASTVFTFQLPVASPVSLKVFDLLGREVATVVDGVFSGGQHRAEWRPDGVAAGVYLYRLATPTQQVTRRMVVIE